LKEWLSRVPFSRSVFETYQEQFRDGGRPNDPVEYAGAVFYLRYTSFGGSLDLTSGFKGTPYPGSEARQFKNKTDALSEFAERLRDVHIENDDWGAVVDRYDCDHTLFYFDPPYEGTEFRHNSEGFDHRRLYESVSSLDGKCVISYDSIPHWYGDGFQVVSKDSNFGVDAENSEWKDATEYLIMNFDSEGEPLMSDVGQQKNNGNAEKAGLRSDPKKYKARQSESEEDWIRSVRESILDRMRTRGREPDFLDRVLAERVAINLHMAANASEYVDEEGLIQTVFVEDGGYEKDIPNGLVTELRQFDKDIISNLKKLGVLNDPDSQQAEATESLAVVLSDDS